MKDIPWGKEKRRSKMGREQYSTGTGVPAPEPVFYVLIFSIPDIVYTPTPFETHFKTLPETYL